MGQNNNQHHVISAKILLNVCVALLVLTALTVFTSRMHLGLLAAPVAFLIATVKAFLVMGFFMGLKYDDKSNKAIFSAGFIFLGIFFFFCALDIWTRINVTSTL